MLIILKIIGLVFLSLLLLLFILTLIPVGVFASYKTELVLQLHYAFIKLTLYPERPQKQRKRRWWKKSKVETKTEKPTADPLNGAPSPNVVATEKTQPLPEKGGVVEEKEIKKEKKKVSPPSQKGKKGKEKEKKPIQEQLQQGLDLLRSSKKALNTIRRHIVLDKLRINVQLSGEDAHKTGEAFGKANLLLTQVLSLLNEFFIVRIKEIHLVPDFLSYKSAYDLEIRVRLRPIWLLKGAVHLLTSFLLMRRKNKRENKGGSFNERKTTAS